MRTFTFFFLLVLAEYSFADLRIYTKDPSDTASNVCLNRVEPEGNDGTIYDRIRVANFLDPRKGNIEITSDSNDQCTPLDECYVAIGDTIDLGKLTSGSRVLTWRTSNGNTHVIAMREIQAGPKNLKFLKGREATKRWDVYLIYKGNGSCDLVPGTCQLYRFEVFPDGLNAYPKPDEPAKPGRLEWNTDCRGTIVQPGGGDGEDDP